MWFYLCQLYLISCICPCPWVFPLLPENRKFIPLFLSGKNVIFQISNFYLKKLSNKKAFPFLSLNLEGYIF